MSDVLTTADGALTVLEDHPSYRRYALAIDVDAAIARGDATLLAPARNALYAQALKAVVQNAALQAVVADVREDGDEQTLDVHLVTRSAIDGGGGPTAGLTLHLIAEYEQREGDPNHREAVLQAVADALTANEAAEELCVRERVVAALVAHLNDALPAEVIREPDRPVPVGSIVIREGGHRADYDAPNRTTYTMAVRVIGVGEDEADAADFATQALAAIRSADRLDGIAVDVAEGETEPSVMDRLYAGDAMAVGLTALVTFATEVGDPYAEAA